ncbi:YlmH family RNA-binding protein [Sporolactobacillus inulinus]|jgi:RNA-binding protein YlmH|uniref:RNA-binding protein S4 n=2 Tax=Sporolactobacillus inulinus TaxID=2078 RepID=A0A0U1QLV3_9BACL|nr:YlmH/Sll1252 family protein [Sporolactobacillus inulinus]KLI01787.1 RNA-binding protein S4 [Sporolactobacillus inulinus CASD]GEB76426.1 RNA-binding protein S4 [Sporolactobacillus inulinus]
MSIYEHFRPEERALIDHFLDLIDQVSQRYIPRLTDFMDPRQQTILRSLIGKNDAVHLSIFGGYEHAERARALLLPPYFEPDSDPFDLAYLDVRYPAKFGSVTHPELLGALLGSGISRNKIGDLLIGEEAAQFICVKELEPYFMLHLTSVGKLSVSCRPILPKNLLHTADGWTYSEGTVSSLRLDTLLSEIYHLPRVKASEAIARGLAKVNWEIVEKRNFDIREGDVISLRGHGRSKIISCGGLTKKNKIRLQYGRLN